MYDSQVDLKDEIKFVSYIDGMKHNKIAILRIGDKVINPLCANLLTHK